MEENKVMETEETENIVEENEVTEAYSEQPSTLILMAVGAGIGLAAAAVGTVAVKGVKKAAGFIGGKVKGWKEQRKNRKLNHADEAPVDEPETDDDISEEEEE